MGWLWEWVRPWIIVAGIVFAVSLLLIWVQVWALDHRSFMRALRHMRELTLPDDDNIRLCIQHMTASLVVLIRLSLVIVLLLVAILVLLWFRLP